MKNLIKKYSSNSNILSLSILMLAFILPFEKTIIRYYLVIFSTTCFFYGDYKVFLNKKNWLQLSLIILWIFPFIQLLAFQKVELYWSNLLTKLSLLIFPIVILIFNGSQEINLGKIVQFFIYGCTISALFCVVYAFFSFYIFKNENAFKYASISVFHHPGYFTMYLNFSIALLYFNLLKPIKNFLISKKQSLTIIIFLTFFVLIAASRTGWITNISIQAFFISILSINKKINKKFLIYILLLIIPFSSIIYFNQTIKNRFQEVILNSTSSIKNNKIRSSTTVRKKIWETSFKLIKKSWLVGYGTGIGKKMLQEQFKKDGYDYMVKKNFNAHNQFLQVLIDHGLIGFLILSFYSFFMIYSTIVKKKFIYTIFLSIIILNFLTESILETQSGVIFFAFFNTILFFDWFNFKTLNT
tara:strand:- start:56 stop:1294 length:1239 start_codon:yes stop_codon:yes gene_type:complete